MMEPKTLLRPKYREIRQRIAITKRHEAAISAAALFANQALFKNSLHIACYLPFKHEFDSLPLIEAIWQAKKYCYLPILSDENTLSFVRYVYGDPLHANRYSILEPVKHNVFYPSENLDVVITPLVAFDRQGHRLGTGGGYYDKTFAFLQAKLSSKPFILGLGFAAQEAESLPVDPWDILLNGMITEKECIYF